MKKEEAFDLFQRVFGGRRGACTAHFCTPSGRKGWRRLCASAQRLCREELFPDCGRCRGFRPLPLTAELLSAHLDGRQAMGVYPIDERGLCRFTVIEPVGGEPLPLMQLMAAAADAAGLTCLRELTDFGRAGRLWIFYAGAASPNIAAETGARVMSLAAVMSGGAPDAELGRILPLPSTDFGKPVMLPLYDRERGFSVFVDSELRPLDGLAALAALEPAPLEEARFPKAAFPKRIKAELSDKLYVDVRGLSYEEIAALCLTARIRNPALTSESGEERPPYLWCLGRSNGRLHLPGGVIDRLGKLTEVELTDSRCPGGGLALRLLGPAQPSARMAARRLLKRDSAVVTAPVGAGKTRLMFEVMNLLRCRTLILATERAGVLRWHRRLTESFGLKDGEASCVTDDGSYPNGSLDTVLLGPRTELWLAECLSGYGLVIVADVDRLHCGAEVFRAVMDSVRARRTYAVSSRPLDRIRWGELIGLYFGGEERL